MGLILIYLCEGSLPWIGLSDEAGKSMKEDIQMVIRLTTHFTDILSKLLNPSQPALRIVDECLLTLYNALETRTILLGVSIYESDQK